MRILLDARMMGPLTTRGIGRYVEELVRALLPQLGAESRLALVVRNLASSPFVDQPKVEHIVADIPWYSWREQLFLPRVFANAHADLVHVPHWNVPVLYRGPLVVTIHDLLLRHQSASAKASTRHPLIAAGKRLGYRLVLANALHQARQILLPTNWVKADVQRLYAIPDERLTVTSEGITALPTGDDRRLPSGPYLLSVGSAYPHKRLDLLWQLWPEFSRRHPNMRLLIAGEIDDFMRRHQAQVERQKFVGIDFFGRVSDAELAALYDHATALTFPSSDEGFGLPPIEALSRGCPVVASDASCLPEVLPSHGVFFFRDGDANAMMQALERLLAESVQARQAAQDNADELQRRYRWDEAARKTLAAYEQLLQR